MNAVLHEAGRAAGNRGADAVASAAVAAAGTGAAHGGHSAAHHGHSGTHGSHAAGLDAVLLTAVPFALAAVVAMLLAHRSQQAGERIYHVSVPYICTGEHLSRVRCVGVW